MIGGDGHGMTEKQKIFADEYIISLNATMSYKKAYPNVKKDDAASVNGSKLLRNTKVKSYIDEQLEKLQSERVANQQEVLEFLTSVMRGEKTEQTLCSIGELGQEVIDIDVGAKDRIKAAELLGKRHRLWTEKVEQQVYFDGNLNITIDYGDEDEVEDSS